MESAAYFGDLFCKETMAELVSGVSGSVNAAELFKPQLREMPHRMLSYRLVGDNDLMSLEGVIHRRNIHNAGLGSLYKVDDCRVLVGMNDNSIAFPIPWQMMGPTHLAIQNPVMLFGIPGHSLQKAVAPP